MIAGAVTEMLDRLHVIVVGPGLGRDPLMQETCRIVVEEARRRKMPFVLDADGLALVTKNPDLVRDCKECILTPNVVEFGRLAQALDVKLPGGEAASEEACVRVAKALGGVVVIQKGIVDYISNGETTLVCDLEGGRKRSGGQGDTLTGSLGTLLAWRKVYLEDLWETKGNYGEAETLMLCAFGGAAITRECSRLAFNRFGRSLQASDLTTYVNKAFETVIGEVDEEGSKL